MNKCSLAPKYDLHCLSNLYIIFPTINSGARSYRHLKEEFMIASIIVPSIPPVRKQQKSLQTLKDI